MAVLEREQELNRVFKEVTLPQLKKMCEWYEEDEGKETTWMDMLISVVAATFETMYTNRGGMFDEKKES